MNKWALRFSIGVLGLVVVILVLIGILFQVNQDLPPPDLRDILIEKPVVAEEDNAARDLTDALSDVNHRRVLAVVEDLNSNQAHAEEAVLELLREYSSLFGRIRSATQKPYLVQNETFLVMAYPPLDEVGFLFQLQLRHFLQEDQEDQAIQLAMDSMKLANLIFQDPQWFRYMFDNFQFLESSGQCYLALIRSENLSRAQLQRLMDVLPSGDITYQATLAAGRNQLEHIQTHFQHFYGDPDEYSILLRYRLHPNRTLSIAVDQYRNMKAYIEAPSGPEMKVVPELQEWADRTTLDEWIKPNSRGMRIIFPYEWNRESMVSEKEMKVLIDVIRLFLAIRMYEDSEGKAPELLSALVPDYLDVLPTDPFSGTHYLYDRERALIWSVGPDGVDQGGSIHSTYYEDGVARWRRRAEDLTYSWKRSFWARVEEASELEDKSK